MGQTFWSKRAAAGLAIWAVLVSLARPGVARAGEAEGTPTEELRKLMTDALDTARRSDQAKLEEIAHGLMIPNYETWLKATFGEQDGAKMAASYKAEFDRQEKWLPTLFTRLAKQEGEWLVEEVREPRIPGEDRCEQALLKATKKGAVFYSVTHQMVLNGGMKVGSSAGYFTLVEGQYRRLDCLGLGLGTPGGVATGRPWSGPVRIGGMIQSARLLRHVEPVYPEEARKQRIYGTVRLHVILAKDGTVEHLDAVSGHPLLLQAALDAVRQWRYQPTLLNGQPVEVDTVVDVTFALNEAPAPNH